MTSDLNFNCLLKHLCVCVHILVSTVQGHLRGLDSLKLGYKGVVSYLTLGAGSSRRSSRINSESLSTELSLQPRNSTLALRG